VVLSPDPVDMDPESDPQELNYRLAEVIGEVFRESGRVSDAAGRVGPSEFAVVAPGTKADGAVRLVERLNQSMEATRMDFRGREFKVRLRAGYCAVPDFAASGIDAVEMLLRATTALRDARTDGSDSPAIRAFTSAPLS
jgi:diguanylate cyclase (GGDEF)-like protein